MSQALCHLGRYDDAETILARLREEVRQGRHLYGQKHWWDAERLLSGENSQFTNFWQAISTGHLDSAAQELETLQSLAPATPRFAACLEGARCVLAEAYQSNQTPDPGQLDWATTTALPGLVSYWPGDGNAQDAVGPNHGTPAADMKFAPGRVGWAFSFDGRRESMLAPSIGLRDLQQFTVACWVKLESMPVGRICVFVALDPEKAVLRYDGPISPRCLHYYIRSPGPDGLLHHIWAREVLQERVFHHVAGTYDGHMMRLYLDGAEVGKCERTGPLRTEEGVLFGYSLDGLLDEVRVYGRALAPWEIALLARVDPATTPAPPKTALGPWRGPASFTGDFAEAPAVGISDAEQFSVALWAKLDPLSPGNSQRIVNLGKKVYVVL